MKGTVADVRCPNCAAPAHYDIAKGHYLCAYCGGHVGISEAIAQRKGFRSLQQEKARLSAKERRLLRASCTGCGAELVFEEGEALASCSFCGRALVRKEYLSSDELPELVIPFRITREEAVACVQDWCRENARRPEARHLSPKLGELQGFYLPYELVRGPVSCSVSRKDGGSTYRCGGYVDGIFVNRSRQLDNLLLDGAEPYELDELRSFDFSYVAGQRAKIADIGSKELEARVEAEVANDYAPVVQKTLETRAVDVSTDARSVLRMPVLLPAYVLSSQVGKAVVNGQTGKVSVWSERPVRYYFLPWWAKAILSTLVISVVVFGALCFFGMEAMGSLLITGMLAAVILTITLAAFSDTVRNDFVVEGEHEALTSKGGPLRRVDGRLVQDATPLSKQVAPPVFFMQIDGKQTPVQLEFSSLRRRLFQALLALVALFLPVILALPLAGFDLSRINLGGSAAWFCVMVPVVPIYLLKFGVIELYENPWIYILNDDGTRTRYRKRHKPIGWSELFRTLLGAAFVPPGCLAVWFGILSFCVTVYLTAGY